jgi:hypothetical protein
VAVKAGLDAAVRKTVTGLETVIYSCCGLELLQVVAGPDTVVRGVVCGS